MIDKEHVLDLIPAYALNCLDEAEFQAASAHLAGCEQCREELRSYTVVVDQLALTSPEAAPSAGVKQALMERVQTSTTQESDHSNSFLVRLANLLRNTAPAWGLASVGLVVLLLVSNLVVLRQVTQQQTTQIPTQLQVVNLTNTDAAPGAEGMIVISGGGEWGTLVVDHLPPLNKDLQYQLWLIRDDTRTSGAVFSVWRDGYGSAVIEAPGNLTDYTSFGITIEPAGGSPGPTGEKVLGGNL